MGPGQDIQIRISTLEMVSIGIKQAFGMVTGFPHRLQNLFVAHARQTFLQYRVRLQGQ